MWVPVSASEKGQFDIVVMNLGLRPSLEHYQKVGLLSVLRNVRVPGMVLPFRLRPVLWRYPPDALHRDVVRVGSYLKDAITEHAGR